MSHELSQPPGFQTLTSDNWQSGFSKTTLTKSIQALEHGHIIYFPHLAFPLFPQEMPMLSTRFSTKKRKNISYHPLTGKLHGIQKIKAQEKATLKDLLNRYADQARFLIENLFPHYQPALIWGRTSYRPLEITQRLTSYRKDDKRLHVDAFPASPNQGKRILRVFCNINPQGEDRIWRIGQPFEDVATQFLPQVPKPKLGTRTLLKLLGITKGFRTLYDHYMLHIHDTMKADTLYQKSAPQMELRFPPGSTWIVFTDQVSHAAMKGQYMLEQTFYLPVDALANPNTSPLRVLENKLGQGLV